MTDLTIPKAFGVLSRYQYGEYELFIEDVDAVQYRFEFGFDELAQLSKAALALVPERHLD